MTTFLEQVSKNSLQVIPAPATEISSTDQGRGGIMSQLLLRKILSFYPKVFLMHFFSAWAWGQKKQQVWISLFWSGMFVNNLIELHIVCTMYDFWLAGQLRPGSLDLAWRHVLF